MNNNSAFKHFAYHKLYKNPIGGLRLGDSLSLSIAISSKINSIYKVNLVLTKDGEYPVFYPMSQKTDLADNEIVAATSTETENKDKNDCLTTNETKLESDDRLYQTDIQIASIGLYFYHFEITYQDNWLETIGRNEFYGAARSSLDEWPIVVFEQSNENVCADSHLRGGIIYQIFVDRFCIGEKRNKTKHNVTYREDWGGIPEYGQNGAKITNSDFFGGNLKGIIQKLDYLSELGVTAIYLNPIFEARSNHKYDTGNYHKIDPDFGTMDDFRQLVKKAGKLNIGIILDGVFSHTGDDSIYFNKYNNYDSLGAYQSMNSPYFEWYDFSDFPSNYASWWGIDTLPNVKENNKYYTEFVCGHEGVLRRWLREGIIGWRLDVADELPDAFLTNINKAVKKENPSAVIIGEVWENAATKISYSERRKYFSDGQLDSVTNYPLKDAIIDFVQKSDVNRLKSTVLEILSTYPAHAVNSLMNILGTHDTQRIRTAFGKYSNFSTRDDRAHTQNLEPDISRKKVMLAAALQFTLAGIPCIYYGDEAGLEGFEDPFNRRCFPHGQEDQVLTSFYKTLGALRKKHANIFANGETEILKADDGIFAYSRTKNDKKIIVIANSTNDDYNCNLNKSYFDILSNDTFTGKIPALGACILID